MLVRQEFGQLGDFVVFLCRFLKVAKQKAFKDV